MRTFGIIAVIFVAAAVIGGFFVIGSPAHQRQVRFDEQRLNDLRSIQGWVPSYYAAKGALPAELSDLEGFQGFTVPTDPETRAPYEYQVQSADTFRLCADFALAGDDGQDGASYPSPYGYKAATSWKHSAGRACFDLTVERASSTPVPPVTVKAVAP